MAFRVLYCSVCSLKPTVAFELFPSLQLIAPAAVVEKAKGELADLEDQFGKVMASLDALPAS